MLKNDFQCKVACKILVTYFMNLFIDLKYDFVDRPWKYLHEKNETRFFSSTTMKI